MHMVRASYFIFCNGGEKNPQEGRNQSFVCLKCMPSISRSRPVVFFKTDTITSYVFFELAQ